MILHRILDPWASDDLHLPSPVSTYLALCGWCDVPYEEVEAEPSAVNCPGCLSIVKAVRTLPKAVGRDPGPEGEHE